MTRPPEKTKGPAATRPSGRRRAAAALNQASILLVDDHPPNLMALEAILGSLGERLVRASSGAEAVEIATREDFAVVLLDLQMPELDGLETAALLKKAERSHFVPIIILTAADPSSAIVSEGYARGAVDFLSKPLDADMLRSKVTVFVDIYKQRTLARDADAKEGLSLIDEAKIARRRAELAELEQRAGEARVRLALDSAGLGTFDFNPTTGALRWDTRSRALFGLSADAAVSYSLYLEGIHPSDRERVNDANRRALDPYGDGSFDVEYRTVGLSDKVERWVAAKGQAFTEDGRAVRFVGTYLDVTAKKKIEQERAALLAREQEARAEAETARARAEAASRAKDEFLATVSHELRNPLNAILGWSRVLLDEGETINRDRQRKGLEVIARNAKAQVQLVEDILEVSRIVSGKLRLSTAATDVRVVVEAAVDTVRSAAQAKGVTLEAHVDPESGTIVADEDRIQQVLWNLLSNAVKFTPRGGSVTVEAGREVDEVLLAVRDTGEGVDPAFLPFVFDRFRQADGSTTRLHGGLGLGLAIVRHLVELHGGTVRADSAGAGKGAIFTVRLPIFAPPQSEDAPRKAQAFKAEHETTAGLRLAGMHVLVLDDEGDMRDLIAMILEHAGARVTRAPTVAAALDLIVSDCPDVAVSDLAMPGADGYAFVKRVRAFIDDKLRDLPLVAMTAYARAEDRHRVLEAGFQRHVAKPIEPDELVVALLEVATARTAMT